MSDWLPPIAAAFIAAAAVLVTTLVNNHSTELQRRDSRAERAEDRDHELERWRQERLKERQTWLLDRRREAYLAALEYIYQADQKDQAAFTKMGQEAELQIYAFGSQTVVDAWRQWLDRDWLPDVAPQA